MVFYRCGKLEELRFELREILDKELAAGNEILHVSGDELVNDVQVFLKFQFQIDHKQLPEGVIWSWSGDYPGGYPIEFKLKQTPFRDSLIPGKEKTMREEKVSKEVRLARKKEFSKGIKMTSGFWAKVFGRC